MKILRNAVFAMVAVAIVLASIIVNYNKNTVVDEKTISSITIKNVHASYFKDFIGQEKEIKNQDDIEAICDVLNSSEREEIQESDLRSYLGAGGYIFVFHYSTGLNKVIYYIDGGPYLYLDDKYYKIFTTKFEKFWDLDYPIKGWRFNTDGSFDENQ